MAAPLTYNTETELSSVNSILGAIGQAPITRIYKETDDEKLEFENPEIAFIYQLLQECNTDVQNEGWTFNRENNFPIRVDGDGHIRVSNEVMQIDGTDNYRDRRYDFIVRQGMVYDRLSHTNVFTPGDIFHFDITFKRLFEDLPSPFRRYITCKASTRAAIQLVSNPQLAQLLNQQEAIARASCVEYECNQGDFNSFNYPDGASFNPYLPFRALQR